MKWIKNLETIASNNMAGICPICKSINTDYGVTVIDENTNMGYGDIWCNDCKNAYHISRIKVTNKMNVKTAPKGLTYG